MKIVSLHVYPIKSLGGISLQSSKLLNRGLEHDRRWMLVDENGVFLSQRQYPKLALFSLSIDENHLVVKSGLNNTTCQIPFNPTGERIEVQIWDDSAQAIEVNVDVSKWFSEQLKQPIRLVYMPDDTKRLVDTRYAFKSEVVSFADGYPLLVVNMASLDNLNDKLKSTIDVARFRPNLVVNGSVAFEEDNWHRISVGESKIEVVKKCARCVMVNIDPITATKETEVLSVLSEYRKKANKVFFGVNALVQQTGAIEVGDELIFN